MSFKKFAVAGVAAAAVVIALAGCSKGTPSASGTNSNIKICMYTHGDGGTFWSVAQNGAEAAAKQLGVTLDYQGSSNDSSKQAQMIEAGMKGGCQGIAASAPDPDAIKTAMLSAHSAGIPTVTLNSGATVFQDLGAFTHFGQDEATAGEAAGTKLNEMGVTNVLCPIQEAANSGLTQRCQGVAKTFKGTVTQLNADGALADPSGAEAKIKAALDANPSIDAVIALNADVATGSVLPAVKAESGRKIQVGTFDMSTDALNAIKDGSLSFAIDQQQYAQGYFAVMALYQAITNGIELGGGQAVMTGPSLVTKDNVDKVISGVAAGIR